MQLITFKYLTHQHTNFAMVKTEICGNDNFFIISVSSMFETFLEAMDASR